MRKKRKKWTVDEKMAVLQEVENTGVSEASRKFGASSTMIYRWLDKFEKEGISGFKKSSKSIDSEKRELELENARLRQVVADQALTIRIKNELLKKSQ